MIITLIIANFSIKLNKVIKIQGYMLRTIREGR